MAHNSNNTSKGKRSPRAALSCFLCRVILKAVERSARILAAAILSFMFLALAVNVFLRYAFSDGIPWAYEIHAILLPWLVCCGIVMASLRGRQIAVFLLPDMLAAGPRMVLMVLVHCIIAAISLAVLWTGKPILVAAGYQTLATLKISQFWGYLSLVYGFGGMAVVALLEIILTLLGGQREDSPGAGESFS